MVTINSIKSVTATSDGVALIVVGDMTDDSGFRDKDTTFVTRPDENSPMNIAMQEWLLEHTGEYTVAPYVATPMVNYRIPKTLPWKRMTEAEADLVYAAMENTSSKLRGTYEAALYLDTQDEFWGFLVELLETLTSPARAKELLAPE